MKTNKNSNYKEFVQDRNTCRNCNKRVIGKFCANCGQKTSIGRYSFKYFLKNNLIYGILNIDGGLFFTLKQLFTRPGHSIREFINGKRIGYFNVITLLLITIGVSHFIDGYTQVKLNDLVAKESVGLVNNIIGLFQKYPQITLLSTIPIYTIFTFIWFRKSKLNLSEHLILNSYKTAGELLIGLVFSLLTVFFVNEEALTLIIYKILWTIGAIIYSFWYYKQFFSVYEYSKKELLIRCFGTIFSYFIFSFVLTTVFFAIKIIAKIV